VNAPEPAPGVVGLGLGRGLVHGIISTGPRLEEQLAYTPSMDSLLLCTFAVGSPDGPRSSSFGFSLARDRSELRLSARTEASRWEMVVQLPPDATGSGDGRAPLTKSGVRQAVFEGAWVGESGLAVAWPGHLVAPGASRKLSLYVSGSALRKFELPAGEPEPGWIAPPDGLGQVIVSVMVAAADEGIPGTVVGEDGHLLGQGALPDGRKVRISAHREEFISPLQKAGLFTALRKRPPPGISQEAAWRDGTRVLFACELDGAGLVVELPGEMFRAPGTC